MKEWLYFAGCGNWRWFRRWHGGKWAFVYVDYPVSCHMWLTIPDRAGLDYWEPLWASKPIFEDHSPYAREV